MNLWDTICSTKDGTLVVWEENHLSRCFLDLLASGVHALIAIISVYYAGIRQVTLRRDHQLVHLLPATWRTHLRKLCCSLLLLRPVVHLVMSQLILSEVMVPSTILCIGVVILTWTVHFFYLQTLTNPLPRHRRSAGEIPVIFAVTAAGLCATFRISALLSLNESGRGVELSFYADLYSNIVSALACAFYLTAAVHCSSTAGETPPRTLGQESLSSVQSYVRLLEADDDNRQLGTAEDTNFISLLTFWWVGRLMRRGYRGHIHEPDDLHDLPISLRPEEVVHGLYRKVDASGLLPSLLVLFHRCVGRQYYCVGLLKFLADILSFASPVLLNRLVIFLEEGLGQHPTWSGYAYASGLALACLLGAFLSTHYSYLVSRVGLKVRAIVVALVYQKTLRADPTELRKSSSEALNLVTTDTDRIVGLCPSLHEAWSLPLQLAVAMFLLWQQVGAAFLAGLVLAVLLVPVNRSITLSIGRLTAGMMAFKDERIKLMSEVLWGMRMIKMHAWESLFQVRITDIRKKEVAHLRQRKYLDALCVFFWVVTPVLMSVLSFITYVLLGNRLTAAKVFTCLALFNLLKVPLNAFPWVINGCMEAWVSLKRTQRFLDLQNFAPASYYTTSTEEDELVRVSNGVFHWGTMIGDVTLPAAITGPRGPGFVLGPVNLSLCKGQLIGVVGRVGSGKSTLLAAILGETRRAQGSVVLQRLDLALGLVPQQPWLQRGTLRTNVLFGRPFDAGRYQAVLECCALLDDLKSLPAGDLTEVGEEGQTLSGGQKRRVALARALYQDSDVYLLDDPLSALDAHVAQHVFERCIMGAMKGKARLLCTHQVGFLAQADHVIVLRDGKVVAAGPPSTVLKSSVIEALPQMGAEEQQPSTQSASSSMSKTSHDAASSALEAPSRMLVEDEEREYGAVRFSTVRSYWDAVGTWLATAVLLSVVLMQVSRTSTDWWLAVWVSWANTTDNMLHRRLIRDSSSDVVNVFLPIYGGLAVANGVFTLARAFLFAYGGIVAAVKVHDLLLDKVLKAPLSFLEATPVGRVLNRFSTDVWSIDDTLPFMLNIVLAQGVALMGTLVVTSYGLPWVLLLLIPLGFAYNSLQQYYRWTSRELRRLGSITLSPVYSHLTETVSGLSVIHSFKAVSRFCQENLHKLAVNQQAVFASQAAAQWLNLRLQLMGVLLTSGVAFLAVVQHQVRGVSAGFVGLALSYALSVTSLLSSLVTSFTDTEKEMVSVERADQYIKGLEEERLDGGILPPFGWPFCGAIKFSKVTLRYRPGLPAALKDISFEAAKGTKVGIVGRTGAGKSTLLQALFRLTPVESGQIFIDGIDVLRMHPKEVRSRLAAIPQDPFVFSGSVRDNVDPRGLHSDAQIWQALDRCQLGRTVRSLGSGSSAGSGLEASLGVRGSLLSAGQRQLLALARALLYKARVLCLDEATAGVDAETDRAIQETIRRTFQGTTILVIAHRVETVLDCDQVLVMSHGKVIESGTPEELLRAGKGHFRTLVEASRKNGGEILIETPEDDDDDDVPLIGFSDP